MMIEKLRELQLAWMRLTTLGTSPKTLEQIPTEIADRAIEALRELTERAKALDTEK